jgi:hypothetical protein
MSSRDVCGALDVPVARYAGLPDLSLRPQGSRTRPGLHAVAHCVGSLSNSNRTAGALPVEAGCAPLKAIKLALFNGAGFLGEDAHIGSIAVGKQADLMIGRRNPALNISEIEMVEIVFKDGVGYDSEKLIQSVQGLVAIR